MNIANLRREISERLDSISNVKEFTKILYMYHHVMNAAQIQHALDIAKRLYLTTNMHGSIAYVLAYISPYIIDEWIPDIPTEIVELCSPIKLKLMPPTNTGNVSNGVLAGLLNRHNINPDEFYKAVIEPWEKMYGCSFKYAKDKFMLITAYDGIYGRLRCLSLLRVAAYSGYFYAMPPNRVVDVFNAVLSGVRDDATLIRQTISVEVLSLLSKMHYLAANELLAEAARQLTARSYLGGEIDSWSNALRRLFYVGRLAARIAPDIKIRLARKFPKILSKITFTADEYEAVDRIRTIECLEDLH